MYNKIIKVAASLHAKRQTLICHMAGYHVVGLWTLHLSSSPTNGHEGLERERGEEQIGIALATQQKDKLENDRH